MREVRIHPDTGTAEVIVPDFQLSLAIGKEGQNARLAARLTGWRVDIKSEAQLAEEESGGGVEYAEGEWVTNDRGELVWQPAEGGEAISAAEAGYAAPEGRRHRGAAEARRRTPRRGSRAAEARRRRAPAEAAPTPTPTEADRAPDATPRAAASAAVRHAAQAARCRIVRRAEADGERVAAARPDLRRVPTRRAGRGAGAARDRTPRRARGRGAVRDGAPGSAGAIPGRASTEARRRRALERALRTPVRR